MSGNNHETMMDLNNLYNNSNEIYTKKGKKSFLHSASTRMSKLLYSTQWACNVSGSFCIIQHDLFGLDFLTKTNTS